jgi:preprotein translocase subunit SecB
VHPNWPDDKIDALVSSNAPALLYGAIREMVVNLTGRSKHGSIHLQTVRFAPSERATKRSETAKAKNRLQATKKA